MKPTFLLAVALALVAACASPASDSTAHVHAAAQPDHACAAPADVAPDAASHTPHTPGRPEVRYYVISDA